MSSWSENEIPDQPAQVRRLICDVIYGIGIGNGDSISSWRDSYQTPFLDYKSPRSANLSINEIWYYHSRKDTSFKVDVWLEVEGSLVQDWHQRHCIYVLGQDTVLIYPQDANIVLVQPQEFLRQENVPTYDWNILLTGMV